MTETNPEAGTEDAIDVGVIGLGVTGVSRVTIVPDETQLAPFG